MMTTMMMTTLMMTAMIEDDVDDDDGVDRVPVPARFPDSTPVVAKK